MEYNVADDSSNYFNNKWRHHDITTIICVLANFLILSDKKFNNMSSQWRQMTSLCQSLYTLMLEMVSIHYSE